MTSLYRRARKSKLSAGVCGADAIRVGLRREGAPRHTRDGCQRDPRPGYAMVEDGRRERCGWSDFLLHDDATLMPPNAPAATWEAGYSGGVAGILIPGNAVSWQADKVEVGRSSDLAYSDGEYQATMKERARQNGDGSRKVP